MKKTINSFSLEESGNISFIKRASQSLDIFKVKNTNLSVNSVSTEKNIPSDPLLQEDQKFSFSEPSCKLSFDSTLFDHLQSSLMQHVDFLEFLNPENFPDDSPIFLDIFR